MAPYICDFIFVYKCVCVREADGKSMHMCALVVYI